MHNVLLVKVCRSACVVDDKLACNRKSCRNLKHHNLSCALACNRCFFANSLKSVRSVCKIRNDMNLFACNFIKCTNLYTGHNVNAVSFADYLTSDNACQAVVVGNRQGVNAAFLCYNDKVFNAYRAIAQLCVAM